MTLAFLLACGSALGQTKPEPFPTVVSVQLVLDPVQAQRPGNEHVKPCGPENHDQVCVDASLPHIVNHLYIHRGNCERSEGVKCTSYADFWAPIGKVVFEEVKPK